jgi:tRNA nucleotidyltransferase/poly(A) polymerase
LSSISTTDKPGDAQIYHPSGALLEVRVKPGFKYLKRTARMMHRGESLIDAVNRWGQEAIDKGAAGFWMEGWQSTVGNQTYNPNALEVVRVINEETRVASTDAESLVLMKWLSKVTKKLGVARHVYVVGGAVRNFVLDEPIKDIDMVVDSLSMRGKDAEWVADGISRAVPTRTKVVTDNLMVSKIFIEGQWELDGYEMEGEVIEIVNARKEEYEVDPTTGDYVGHKPIRVEPTTLEDDATRREFTFNTLMWRLTDLANGPDKAEIIDLTGCGLKDLENREMRCPREPDETFKEDPTRIIRTIKFAFKYGFKLPKDTAAAARRQAKGLKRIPSKTETVLKTVILDNPQYKKALDVMADLGVLDVLKEMMQEHPKTFGSFMVNHAREKGFVYMFDLMDVGLAVGGTISFLKPKERLRFREISIGLSQDEATVFLGGLKNPGNVYKDKKFFGEMMVALQLDKKGLGQLGGWLTEYGRHALLADPSLVNKGRKLKELLRSQILKDHSSKRSAARQKGKSLAELGTWPLSKVTVYRGVLAEVTHFQPMDYVTRTKKFALGHAEHIAAVEEEETVVLKAKVSTADVYEAYNPGEWFYDGPKVRGQIIHRQKSGSVSVRAAQRIASSRASLNTDLFGMKAARRPPMKTAALPLMSPLYNMREVCKQIVLLEDHLNHPEKRCSDCISKHFLTIEALVEEAVSLDAEGEHEDLLGLPSFCRHLQQRWLDGEPERGIAQELRQIRKIYITESFDLRAASFVADVYTAKQHHVCGR